MKLSKVENMFKHLILAILASQFLVACGDNFLESLEEKDNVVDATIALDDGDPDKAIELCLEELGSVYKAKLNEYTSGTQTSTTIMQNELSSILDDLESSGSIRNPRNVASILASAYAQKAGVDMVGFALNLAEQELNSTGSTSMIEDLGNALNPNPSADVLDQIDYALVVLRGIGTSNYRSAESYKESIFVMANMALFASSLPDLSAITLDDALEILAFLENALGSASGADEDPDSQAQASLDAINTIYTSIGVNTGDSDAVKQQKVQDFLNGN